MLNVFTKGNASQLIDLGGADGSGMRRGGVVERIADHVPVDALQSTHLLAMNLSRHIHQPSGEKTNRVSFQSHDTYCI